MDGQGFQVPRSTKAKSGFRSNFLSVGLNIFQKKSLGLVVRDVRTRVEDNLVKVVCGGTAPSMPAYSATCTDPHTQSVLSNQSVFPLSLVAEDTEQ